MSDDTDGTVTELPRGLRNHNPGNLRDNPDHQWLGQIGVDDAGFCIFGTPAYGIRALIHTLHTYYFTHHLNTIGQIITRWAPPSENDTAAYISAVVESVGDGANDLLEWHQVSPDVALAIIEHENGSIPYDAKVINDGIVLADAH